MKALLTITYPRMVANSTGQRIRAYVQGIIQGEQPPVLLLDDGARVEALYRPDNSPDANCYTPKKRRCWPSATGQLASWWGRPIRLRGWKRS